MADFLLRLTLSLLAAFSLTFPATGKTPTFLKSVKPSPIKLGNEKFSHFQFYWHDIQSGSNPTSVNIVQSPANNFSTPSPTGFGSVNMIDDPLTERPDLGSTLLGRAQGFYGLASQEEIGLLMAMSFMFTTGKYNGSTLTVMGRNPVSESVREMPVIGGSGLFRFARGYVQATTMAFNTITRDAVVEYNVYVLHY